MAGIPPLRDEHTFSAFLPIPGEAQAAEIKDAAAGEAEAQRIEARRAAVAASVERSRAARAEERRTAVAASVERSRSERAKAVKPVTDGVTEEEKDPISVFNSLVGGIARTGPTQFFDFLDGLTTYAAEATGLPKSTILSDKFFAEIGDLSRYTPEEQEKQAQSPLAERIARGVGAGLTGGLPKLSLASAATGGRAGVAALSGIEAAMEGGDATEIGTAVLKGFMLDQIFKASEPLTRATKAGAIATATAADSVAQGRPVEGVVEDAAVMGIMGAIGRSGNLTARGAVREALAAQKPSGEAAIPEVPGEPTLRIPQEMAADRPETAATGGPAAPSPGTAPPQQAQPFTEPAPKWYQRLRTRVPREMEGVIKRTEMVRAIEKAFDVPIDVGVSREAVSSKSKRVLGYYKPRAENIRIRSAQDVPTVAHEVAHMLDNRVFSANRWRSEGKPENAGVKLHRKVFHPWLDELSTIASPGPKGSEGFAEFVRHYVQRPAFAAQAAPRFYRDFEAMVKQDAPEAYDMLHWMRRQWAKYEAQPALAKARSQYEFGPPPHPDGSLLERAIKTPAKAYNAIVNQFYPARRMMMDLYGKPDRDASGKRVPWSNVQAVEDTESLLHNLAGSQAKIDAFIKRGRGAISWNDPLGERGPIGPSLEDIMARIPKSDYQDFSAYLGHRAQVFRFDNAVRKKARGERAVLPQLTTDIQSMRTQLAEAEARPGFKAAADEINTLQRQVLNYFLASGYRGKYRALEKFLEDPENFYVPLWRFMEGPQFEKAGGKGQGGGFSVENLWDPIGRAKSSSRQVLDPIQNVMRNIHTLVHLAEKNEVAISLAKAMRRPGAGKYLQEYREDMVPVPLHRDEVLRMIDKFLSVEQKTKIEETVKTTTEGLDQIAGTKGQPLTKAQKLVEDRVLEALKARGFSDGEARQMLERVRTTRREAVAEGAASGDDEGAKAVIREIIEKVRTITIETELGFNVPERVFEIFRPKFLSKGENVITAWEPGKTKPTYMMVRDYDLYRALEKVDRTELGPLLKAAALPAAIVRAGVVTNPEFSLGSNPARDIGVAILTSKYGFRPWHWPGAMWRLIGNEQAHRRFMNSGAAMANLVSMDRNYLSKEADRSWQRAHQKWLVDKAQHPIETAYDVLETLDNATRAAELELAYKAETARGASGRELAHRIGAAGRDVTIDFARTGARVREAAALSAFWKPVILGLDKLGRTAIDDPVGFTLRTGATIILPAIAHYLINRDNALYDRVTDKERDLWWIQPLGHVSRDEWAKMTPEQQAEILAATPILQWPKQHEMGILFGTGTQRALEWWEKDDPEQFEKFANTFMANMGRSVIPWPSVLTPGTEWETEFSFYNQLPTVPRSLQGVEEEDQWVASTMQLTRRIGRAFGASPVKIENFLRQATPGVFFAGYEGVDAIYRAALGNELPVAPERGMSQMFFFRRFAKHYPKMNDEEIRGFYDRSEPILTATASLHLAKRRQNRERFKELVEQYGPETFDVLSRFVNQVNKSLGEQREILERIRDMSDDRARKEFGLSAEVSRSEIGKRKARAIDVGILTMIDFAQDANRWIDEILAEKEERKGKSAAANK